MPMAPEPQNTIRTILWLGGGPAAVMAYEVWQRVASNYQLVRREDLQQMLDALEQAILNEQLSQRVTDAQREEIDGLRRDIDLLEKGKADYALRLNELAARLDRVLSDMDEGGGQSAVAPPDE